MTPEEEDALHDRFKAMSEQEREALDSICTALREYLMRDWKTGPFVSPNRIIALACADLTRQWQKTIMERE